MVFNMNTLLKIKTYSLYTIMFMLIPFIVGIVQDNFAMAIDNLGDDQIIPHNELVDNALILVLDEVDSIRNSEPTDNHLTLIKREKALKDLDFITSNFNFSVQ